MSLTPVLTPRDSHIHTAEEHIRSKDASWVQPSAHVGRRCNHSCNQAILAVTSAESIVRAAKYHGAERSPSGITIRPGHHWTQAIERSGNRQIELRQFAGCLSITC